MNEKLYQLFAFDACAGVVVRHGIVTKAAPFFKWMIGKKWNAVSNWRHIEKIIEVY